MGRKAGVTAEETRAQLLDAAAEVIARKGYDRASIADITAEADLTSGAIYASYGSKAELFVAALADHGRRQYQVLLGSPDVDSIADVFTKAGSSYDRRPVEDAALVLEALLAAKHDPEIAGLVSSWLTDTERGLAASIEEAQVAGELDGSIQARTISRVATMLALGSSVIAALDVEAPDHEDWTRVIGRLVDSVRA